MERIQKIWEHPLYQQCPSRIRALEEKGLVQRESGQILRYRLTGEEGPDHDKRFFVEVDLNGSPVGSGTGRSKKEAEQMAAKAAIAGLEHGNGR